MKRPPLLALVGVALFLVGSFVAFKLIAIDYSRVEDGMLAAGTPIGRDFINVWTAGQLVLGGKSSSLYAINDYLAFQHGLFGNTGFYAYSYPPSTLFIALLFALLPYPAALFAWLAGTASLFLWAARPYVREVPGFPLAAAAITPAATINIWSGHYGFLVGALWLACFAAQSRYAGRSGLFAGLLTIKPHLGILIPPVLLLRRQWRTILVAAATAIGLILASGLLFGFDLWRAYLPVTSSVQSNLLEQGEGIFLFMMPTTYAALRVVGAPEWLRWTGQLLTASLALAMCWHAVRRNAGWQDLAFIGATATFLILPYGFNYDMTAAVLGFALLLFGKWHSLGLAEKIALALAFCSPQLVMLLGPREMPLTPLFLLAALSVQVRHSTVATHRNSTASSPA